MDFCQHVISEGLRILMLNDYRFVQELGYEFKEGWAWAHPPFREYYQVRDYLYLLRRDNIGSPVKNVIREFMSMLRVFFRGDDGHRFARMYFRILGIRDAILKRTGPLA